MSKEEIVKQIDLAISDLVYKKVSLIKAYNYYNGKRDAEQFRHLEQNFGIGTPTQIEFTPLTRKHIDALVGEYTSIPTKPKISCKDDKTLNNIMRDKQLLINSEVFNYYKSKLNNTVMQVFQQGGQQGNAVDPLIEKELKLLVEDLNENYTSDYEIASQNIIQYTMQSRNIDFETKKTILAKDLYITGTAYYKVYKTENGDQFDFEVLNPLHTFIDRNPNSVYLKDSYRSVIRRYLNKFEILSKYGSIMTDNAISEVKKIQEGSSREGNTYYVRSIELFGEASEGIVAGLEVMPGLPSERDGAEKMNRLIEVYEVEWLDVEKEGDKFVMYRYEGIRINGNIYIPIGKVEEISRSVSAPTKASLTVNGIFFSDRNGTPFSLILATANLQDKYDILHFYRDNVFAASGVKGDWLDISMLPTFLGKDITERIMKYQAYKKQLGVGIIDSSQEGRAFNNNTTLAGYDDSLRGDVIQAFDYAIQSIENTCSSITGVGRERLGGIEQKDAVSNVEVGVRMSAIITRQYFQVLDTLIKEILTDCLNMAKIVYKSGITGTIILGEKLQKIFTALPEHFTLTDFDIHVNDSSEMVKDMETIKAFTTELIKAGIIDAQTSVDAIDTKSLTELKRTVSKGIKAQDEKNGMAQQLQQQVQQYEQQLQELQKQLQDAQGKLQQAEQTNDQATKEVEQGKLEVEWFKARNDKDYRDKELQVKQQQVQAEVLQLYDGNPKNDEVKNI